MPNFITIWTYFTDLGCFIPKMAQLGPPKHMSTIILNLKKLFRLNINPAFCVTFP